MFAICVAFLLSAGDASHLHTPYLQQHAAVSKQRKFADAHPIDVQQAVSLVDLSAALTAGLSDLQASEELRSHAIALRNAALTMLTRLCQRAQGARPVSKDQRYAGALVLAGDSAASSAAAASGSSAGVPVPLAAACVEVLRCSTSCACAPVQLAPQHSNSNFVSGCAPLLLSSVRQAHSLHAAQQLSTLGAAFCHAALLCQLSII